MTPRYCTHKFAPLTRICEKCGRSMQELQAGDIAGAEAVFGKVAKPKETK